MSDKETIVDLYGDFTHPCAQCQGTVTVVGGQRLPHECAPKPKSSDLDAVRKAYDEAHTANFPIFAGDSIERTLADLKVAHDAGLAAVVEWAMNRAAEDLRWLAEGRRHYFRGDLSRGYWSMSAVDQAIYSEYTTAGLLADVLAGTNGARGWLPSHLWADWAERRDALLKDLTERKN